MAELPSGWNLTHVKEVAGERGLVGGPFGSSLGTKDYVADGVPVIRGGNLASDGYFDSSDFVFVSDEKADSLARNIALPGDLVLTQRGTLGQVGLVPEGIADRFVISQSQMRLRCDRSRADEKFLYYVFCSPKMLATIGSQAIVTGVPHINLGMLGDFEVLLPPLPEQRAIAEVLGALDDKIESNRRVVDCGTSLIQAEFDSAKSAADTQTSLREEISSPRGIVQTGPFGSNLHASDYTDEGTPLLLVKHVLGGLVRYEALPLVSQDKASELEAYKLALNDIVITRVGRVGDAALIGPAEVGWMFSGQMLRIRAAGLSLDPFWLAAWFLSPAFKEVIDGYAVGSTRQSLSTGILLESPMPKVSIERQVQFRKVVEPIQGAIWNSRSESIKLARLRDTLLPALLSGRIRVPAAAELVEAS